MVRRATVGVKARCILVCAVSDPFRRANTRFAQHVQAKAGKVELHAILLAICKEARKTALLRDEVFVGV